MCCHGFWKFSVVLAPLMLRYKWKIHFLVTLGYTSQIYFLWKTLLQFALEGWTSAQKTRNKIIHIIAKGHPDPFSGWGENREKQP
jgi:hypothetical protein